jgi:hypothetical protein
MQHPSAGISAAADAQPQERLSVTDALLQMQQAVRSGEMQQVS